MQLTAWPITQNDTQRFRYDGGAPDEYLWNVLDDIGDRIQSATEVRFRRESWVGRELFRDAKGWETSRVDELVRDDLSALVTEVDIGMLELRMGILGLPAE